MAAFNDAVLTFQGCADPTLRYISRLPNWVICPPLAHLRTSQLGQHGSGSGFLRTYVRRPATSQWAGTTLFRRHG